MHELRVSSLFCLMIVGFATCGLATVSRAEEPAHIRLWAGAAPEAHGDAENDIPWMTPYLPAKDKATGTAIVVCPGGGYAHIAMEHEGKAVAEWLNGIGVAAFVLKYRHHGTGYGHPAPLLDVQRALRVVRSRAEEFGIKPDRIGVMGFSAGGHLACSSGTHFVPGVSSAEDPVDRVSSRPDFMVLVYPVITFTESFMHRGSRNNLIGEKPDEGLIVDLSNERQVTDKTPPTFLVHTDEDRGVPSENSISFYLALRKAKVPAEMHIFEKGPHGFGVGKPELAASKWPDLCETWMRARGVLAK